MNNNRRSFLTRLGAVLAGAATAGSVISDAKASITTEPVKVQEPQIVYRDRDIPTFEEVLAKAKDGKELNDLEILVFVGEFTLAAHKIDLKEQRKLLEQGISEGFSGMIYDAHPNNSAIYYWSCIQENVRNMIKVHDHVESVLLAIVRPYKLKRA